MAHTGPIATYREGTMDSFIIDDTEKPVARRDALAGTVGVEWSDQIPPEVRDTYLRDLEEQVRELIGTEPKDFARAAILIYDICRLRGEGDQARLVRDVFDVPAIVLYQVPPLVRTIGQMGDTSTPDAVDAVLGRIDDLTRLVVMALEGDGDADIVRRLVELRTAVTEIPDRERPDAVSSAADSLAHLVNAFFFDRLTAIPALRTYVVGLELGL